MKILKIKYADKVKDIYQSYTYPVYWYPITVYKNNIKVAEIQLGTYAQKELFQRLCKKDKKYINLLVNKKYYQLEKLPELGDMIMNYDIDI